MKKKGLRPVMLTLNSALVFVHLGTSITFLNTKHNMFLLCE